MDQPVVPMVSVVMPSMNQAGFIEAAMESVLGQPYPRVELIVADGGSRDGTLGLLAERQARDPRLRWFSGPDRGPAQALNKALRQARGTIIGWLNSDDLYTPGAIPRAVSALESHGDWLMVYGHGLHIDARGVPLDDYPTLLPTTPVSWFANGCFICQPTVFFRRTLFLLLGGLDEELMVAFDFEYWLRAFRFVPQRIGFVDVLQAESRLHQDCITRKLRRNVTLESMKVLARHLGQAPGLWLRTYLEEVLAMHAQGVGVNGLRQDLLATVQEAAPWMDPDQVRKLLVFVQQDPRIRD